MIENLKAKTQQKYLRAREQMGVAGIFFRDCARDIKKNWQALTPVQKFDTLEGIWVYCVIATGVNTFFLLLEGSGPKLTLLLVLLLMERLIISWLQKKIK